MNSHNKCGCGRSPTGFCIGWHALSEDAYKKAKSDYEYEQYLWAAPGSVDTNLSELRLLELYRTHVAQS